ncbi:MAG TPA: protein kinase [Polyangiaceae bacterium]|nr:protein kinase [Polyangiaceae bacterium]
MAETFEGPLPRIGRYELVGEIASGGMAVVYLARLAGVGGFRRLFALKRLHRHLARETEFVAMFLDEARLAASVHSAHVVPILEVGISEAGDHFVVMDYVEGASLASLIVTASRRQGRVPESVALRVVLDALEGLHAAHEARDERGEPLGIVHRDVSPHNLLVGVDGVARLTDFGIARAATRLSTTRDGTFKGKLSYMAPEQASGENVDRRADVFAAAVVAWELLANRRLFKGTNDLHTVHLLLYAPIPPLGEARPGVPPALDEALARALDRDPAARYATAADFARAIERAAEGWLPLAPPRDLAAFVESIAADELSRQRELLRTHAGLPAMLSTVELPLVPPDPFAPAAPATPSQAVPRPSAPPASQPAPRFSTPPASRPAPRFSTPPTSRPAPRLSAPPASQPAPRLSAPLASQPAPQLAAPPPASAEALSTAEAQAALRGQPLWPRLVALAIGAGLAALVAAAYVALRDRPRHGAEVLPSARPAARASAAPEREGAAPPPTPAPTIAAPALPEASAAPSASAGDARPPRPPRTGVAPPPRPPADTSRDEYPGLNPYR